MHFENIQGFYLSSLFQTLIIAATTMILYYLLGDGIFGDLGQGNTNNNSSQGIIKFNGYVLIYVIIGLVFGSVIFYLIFTKLKDFGIRIVYTIVLGSSFLIFIWEVLGLLFSRDQGLVLSIIYSLLVLLVSIFGVYFLYIYIKGQPDLVIRNAGIVFSAVIIGRMMALYFDLLSIIIFALILGVFDVYSVFQGPLSKVMGKPQRRERNMVNPSKDQLQYQFRIISNKGTPVLMSYQNTILGIGDVLFFSILMYKAMIEWSLIGILITTIAIGLGSIGTLLLLQKVSPLPGLPIPVSLSLLGYVFLSVIY